MINQDTITGPSFSFTNRVMRYGWGIVYLLLFRHTPIPFYKWRTFILIIFHAKIGSGVRVYPKVKIWAPWNLEIEDQSCVANGVTLYNQAKITIGRRSTISQGAHLCAGTHDYTKPGFPVITKPIEIGDHVWIAADAFIHPGIKIDEGCIIGARSVVSKNMPAWMVCSGHPCKPIKKRVEEEDKIGFFFNMNLPIFSKLKV